MAGTTFTELFGDASKLCWLSGPETCTQKWAIGAGSGYSIISAPGTPPADAGSYALQLVKSASAASYLYTAGTFPRIPSGTTFDLYFSLYFSAYSVANYGQEYVLTVGSNTNPSGGAFAACARLYKSATDYQLQGRGSTTSANQSIALNTWYSCRLHVEAGTNASYLKVGANANQTFTAAAYDGLYIIAGTNVASANTYTAAIGHLFLDSALAGYGDNYSMYADFENGNNNDVPTTTSLAAGTRSGNGVWAISPSPLTSWIISTDGQFDLPASLSIGGASYPDTASTRGIRIDASISNQRATYRFTGLSDRASIGFFIKVPSTTGDGARYYALCHFNNISGTDGVGLMVTNGQMYLETSANPNGDPDTGSKYTYTADAVYWVTIQYKAGGPHSLAIYDSSWTKVADMTKAGTGSANPNNFYFGRHADWITGEPQRFFYYDNFIVDYLNGTYPLLPPMPASGFALPIGHNYFNQMRH
jgi:hypothetical protein